jgi:hypothetical protein
LFLLKHFILFLFTPFIRLPHFIIKIKFKSHPNHLINMVTYKSLGKCSNGYAYRFTQDFLLYYPHSLLLHYHRHSLHHSHHAHHERAWSEETSRKGDWFMQLFVYQSLCSITLVIYSWSEETSRKGLVRLLLWFINRHVILIVSWFISWFISWFMRSMQFIYYCSITSISPVTYESLSCFIFLGGHDHAWIRKKFKPKYLSCHIFRNDIFIETFC